MTSEHSKKKLVEPTPEDIRNLSMDELIHYLESIHEKSFRATQIFEWIYQKGVWSFDEMLNLSQPLRDRLK